MWLNGERVKSECYSILLVILVSTNLLLNISDSLSAVGIVDTENMQDKKMVGIVVGSYDTEAHANSIQDGEAVAKTIEEIGEFDACLIEIGKGPWLLHYDDTKATFDKEKFGTMIRRQRIKPEVVILLTKGKVGESGELQEYFDKMGVPFSGSALEDTR